ncbi:MAG: glycosyltransferase [Bacteroidales bacterium]|nr:glycosyltransferase [Bacteroidales bacterium]
MKIIMIGSAFPLRGGLSNFNERMCEELINMGHDVTIYTFSLQYPSIFFPGKSQYSTEPYSGRVPIKVVINSVNPFNWLIVGNRLRREKADLIVIKFWIPFMAPCFGTILRIARLNKTTKAIAIIDNIIPHEKRPGDRILASFFAKSVDAFVAMSRKVMTDIQLFNTRKPILFNPHPIYDNFGTPVSRDKAVELLGLDKSFRYILFFGFIRDYKGLDILLNAMADKRLLPYNIKLIVAGEFYTDSKPYLDIIRNHGIEDRVVLSNDFIPDSEVFKYFSASDIVVQPYKTATQSGVTQIAYNFDKPMIITRVGGLEEFVPDEKVGFVASPDDVSIANSIVRFYEENREEHFITNIKIEKKKFSWDHWVNQMIDLFKGL